MNYISPKQIGKCTETCENFIIEKLGSDIISTIKTAIDGIILSTI